MTDINYPICEGCKQFVREVYPAYGYQLCNWCSFVENTPAKSQMMRDYAKAHGIEPIELKMLENTPSYAEFILKWVKQ